MKTPTSYLTRTACAGVLACGLAAAAHAAPTGVVITEWMYNGGPAGEYVEFTNFGSTAVDFTGWSFDDSSRSPGAFSLSALGTVAPGESVIMSEASASDFRAAWGLSGSVKVVGLNDQNLGRGDEMNLYNGTTLVDRLTYGDNTAVGGIRTASVSGRAGTVSVLGTNDVKGWVLSSQGDADKSFSSDAGDIGSPGFTAFAVAAPVPEPETYLMLVTGLLTVASIARRRSKK